MDLKDKNLSLQLYNYLCYIIGSKEVVRKRREIFTAIDIVEYSTGVTHISSGSKAEGLDLKGSDYDQMLVCNFIRVYENLNNVQYDPDHSLLVMDTNDTKPGFTKLKVVKKSDLLIDMIHDCGDIEGKETYISSKRFREHFLSGDSIIHGPCVSTPDGNIEQAVCFRCKEWITPAQQWINRSCTTWPDYELVTSSVQYGVLFVPVGCKNSPNVDLEWRISFSVTEKLFIHSFSHTQLLCYALMKIILKDIIKPKHGELLCSYFLKTIMFWLSEEINPSGWKPENMIPCFFGCIRRLIYCVEYKTCLHYFIPENNLFEDRFTDKEHKALLNTLRFIYESPWISVLQTSTFQNYRLASLNSHGMILSSSELSCHHYLDTAMLSFMSEFIYTAIQRLVNVISNKELCTYVLSICAREVLQSSHLCNVMARNKLFYQQYKILLCYFKLSLHSDSITSWLLLASLFYKCRRFLECRDIIDYCLSRCTPDKIYLHFDNSLAEQTVFNKMSQKLGLLHAFKYLMIENVCFHYPFCLLPDKLIPLIVQDRLWIPPVVYSYLLQFLCCFHLGDNSGKHNALRDLELTIMERYFIVSNLLILRIVHKSLEIVRALI